MSAVKESLLLFEFRQIVWWHILRGYDDRPKELIDSYYERDLITRLSKEEPEKYAEYIAEAKERIDKAVEAAEATPMAKELHHY